MITTLQDLLVIVNRYYEILNGHFNFDSNGWPLFKNNDFLTEWPQDVITYDNRNSSIITSPKKEVVLCFFAGDKQNYRRFEGLERDMKTYHLYKAVAIPDITLTQDMDIELQNLIMLANQLFAAVLVYHDIKIVFNTRSPSSATNNNFIHVPRNIMCISGFLGCKNSSVLATRYVNKILTLMPNKLIIYGKHDPYVDAQLDTLGISYRYYDDFHSRSKRREK